MTNKIRDKMFVMGVPHRVIIQELVSFSGPEGTGVKVITPVSMVYSNFCWCVLANVQGEGMRTIPINNIHPNWD